jgi:hypothetical protein
MPNTHASKWLVHKFYINEIKPPKNKFVVILQVRSTSFLGAFINTEIPDWLQKPGFEHCHCVLPQSTHPFLNYDSKFHVNERNIKDYEFQRISPGTLVGEVHLDSRETIKTLLTRCKLLEINYARELLAE